MLEKLLPYEKSLFFLINGSYSYFMDCVMWLFSGGIIWIPAILFLLISIIHGKRWQVWLPILIAIVILFIGCDQFSSAVCKPFFARLRPTYFPGIEEHVRTLYGYAGGQYGFISGHATNSFGFATLTALLFSNRYYSITIYIWALVLSYSRVYLGVHFVSDVVAGAISGCIIGWLVYSLYHFYQKKNKGYATSEQIYSTQRIKLITVVLSSYIVLITLLSELLIYIFRMNFFS